MSEIKTAEQRIHKLEGGEGDSFVTFEQALIAERDELRAALAERDAELAALKKQEPVAEVDEDDNGLFVDLETPNGTVVKFGQKLYAAAGAASEWNDFVEIACARIKSADDAAADGDYMLDSSDCIKVLRGTWGGNYLNDHPVLPAAGAAPVPDMFWNSDDAETLYSSIDEFLNDEICNGSLEVGDIRTVQQAKRLPDTNIKITAIDDTNCEAEWEALAAAPKEQP